MKAGLPQGRGLTQRDDRARRTVRAVPVANVRKVQYTMPLPAEDGGPQPVDDPFEDGVGVPQLPESGTLDDELPKLDAPDGGLEPPVTPTPSTDGLPEPPWSDSRFNAEPPLEGLSSEPASDDAYPLRVRPSDDAFDLDDQYSMERFGGSNENDAKSVDVECVAPGELLDPIHKLTTNVAAVGRVPKECPLESPPFDPRAWSPMTYTWKASGLCHKPLYFEDVQLERYGHSWGPLLQPLASGAHFFLTVPVLPYKMGLTPPNECMYTLGYYRPGNCAPYQLDPIPLSVRAGLAQAGGVLGMAFLTP